MLKVSLAMSAVAVGAFFADVLYSDSVWPAAGLVVSCATTAGLLIAIEARRHSIAEKHANEHRSPDNRSEVIELLHGAERDL